MTFKHDKHSFSFKRYPDTSNRSLRPWSAADELILDYLNDVGLKPSSTAIYNDRFGFLSTVLHAHQPYTIISYASQEKAIRQNQLANKTPFLLDHWHSPLDELPNQISLGIIRIPKSVDLFKLYLHQLSASLTDDGHVVCAFMTRHFSPQWLTIAEQYFEIVEQSKARKKARLLILRKKRPLPDANLLHQVSISDDYTLQQYYGVFSANHVDYATQFLLDHLSVQQGKSTVLDLASGNGVIARYLMEQNPESEIHLLDDSFLAVESSKLNVSGEQVFHHYNDSLELFQPNFFDLVVSNPPFHFEYETNIEVALGLFKEVAKCLKDQGRFVLVGNKHLNYRTHLIKLFNQVDSIAENEKFIIYECIR